MIAFYVVFLIAYSVFSYVGVFQLRKADQLDFTSERIISLYFNISIAIIVITALAIILELFYL
jgi:hypothetical protein